MKKQIWKVFGDKKEVFKILSCNQANIIFDEIKENDTYYEIWHNGKFVGHLFKPENEIKGNHQK